VLFDERRRKSIGVQIRADEVDKRINRAPFDSGQLLASPGEDVGDLDRVDICFPENPLEFVVFR